MWRPLGRNVLFSFLSRLQIGLHCSCSPLEHYIMTGRTPATQCTYHLVGETAWTHCGPDDGLEVSGDLVQVDGGVDVAVGHQVVRLPPDGLLDLRQCWTEFQPYTIFCFFSFFRLKNLKQKRAKTTNIQPNFGFFGRPNSVLKKVRKNAVSVVH